MYAMPTDGAPRNTSALNRSSLQIALLVGMTRGMTRVQARLVATAMTAQLAGIVVTEDIAEEEDVTDTVTLSHPPMNLHHDIVAGVL